MSVRIPKYRKHSTGNAFVEVDGKRLYLGEHNSPQSKEAYRRIVAEVCSGQTISALAQPIDSVTVNELVVDYIKRHVDVHYRKNGEPTSEARHIRDAVRPLCQLFGSEPASEFGPLKLELVRAQYVAAEMVRRSVNRHASRIKRLFKWAVAKQIVNPTIYQALACVDGLRAGRSAAKESKPVRPASEAMVAKTLPYLPPPVAAMVRLQLLTGSRPGEICILRPCDITKGEDNVWTYIPESHKCEHHGTERRIFIGPEAQKVLAPWLEREPTAYCFSPKESRNAFDADRRSNRKSPMTPSQANRKRLKYPRKAPKERYSVMSYGRSIRDACWKATIAELMAGGLTKEAAKEKAKTDGLTVAWAANQLRHARATELRRKYGIEVAQCILGHTKLTTTEVYAERDFERAAEVMKEVG